MGLNSQFEQPGQHMLAHKALMARCFDLFVTVFCLTKLEAVRRGCLDMMGLLVSWLGKEEEPQDQQDGQIAEGTPQKKSRMQAVYDLITSCNDLMHARRELEDLATTPSERHQNDAGAQQCRILHSCVSKCQEKTQAANGLANQDVIKFAEECAAEATKDLEAWHWPSQKHPRPNLVSIKTNIASQTLDTTRPHMRSN